MDLRGGAALLILGAACRAAPIAESARYPAGTELTVKYVTVDGTRIRYVERGRGPPVILLHGFGASIYSWRWTIGPVSNAGFRVIAFDNRGFGGSDQPDTGYTNRSYARLVLDLMDSLHADDAVLVGHSMGGAIAAEAALAAPSRVRGLVLLDAAGYGPRQPVPARLGGARWVARLVTVLRSRRGVAMALRSSYADPARVTDAEVDQYYWPVARSGFGRAVRGVLREFAFEGLRGRLDSVRVPTLVMWGSEDRWISESVGRQMARDLPRVAFVLIPHAGHDLPEEAPVAVNRTLIAFLKDGLPTPPTDVAMY